MPPLTMTEGHVAVLALDYPEASACAPARQTKVYDHINVIQGEANLNQTLLKDKQCDNLFVLAASQTRGKDALTKVGVEKVLNDLSDMGFEYIVCTPTASSACWPATRAHRQCT